MFCQRLCLCKMRFLVFDEKKKKKNGDRHVLACMEKSREQNNALMNNSQPKQLCKAVAAWYCIINHFLIIGALDIILMKLQGKLHALHCNNRESTFITWFVDLMAKQINK